MRAYYENPDWYRAQYNLAATWANWATSMASVPEQRTILADFEGEIGGPPPIKQAESAAVELLDASWHARRKRRRVWSRVRRFLGRLDKKEDAALQAFLADTIEPTTLILWAGMELLQSPDQTDERAEGRSDRPREEMAGRKVFRDRRALVRAVLRREAVDPVDVVKLIDSERGLNASVHYNLACLLLQLGERGVALSHLEAAMEQTPPAARTMMATRMRTDPALETLKDELDRLLSQRFDIGPVKKEMFEALAAFMRQMRPFGPASRGGT